MKGRVTILESVHIYDNRKKTIPFCDDGCIFQDRVYLAHMHQASHSVCSVTLQLVHVCVEERRVKLAELL